MQKKSNFRFVRACVYLHDELPRIGSGHRCGLSRRHDSNTPSDKRHQPELTSQINAAFVNVRFHQLQTVFGTVWKNVKIVGIVRKLVVTQFML